VIWKCLRYIGTKEFNNKIGSVIMLTYLLFQIPLILLLYGSGVKIEWVNIVPDSNSNNTNLWALPVRTWKTLMTEWFDTEYDYIQNKYYDD
jgi:hypothetical protein